MTAAELGQELASAPGPGPRGAGGAATRRRGGAAAIAAGWEREPASPGTPPPPSEFSSPRPVLPLEAAVFPHLPPLSLGQEGLVGGTAMGRRIKPN